MANTPDYAALAKAAGAIQPDTAATPSAPVTATPPATPPVTPPAVSTTPAPAASGVDYAALAKQAGAVNADQTPPAGVAPTGPIAPAANSADVHQGSSAWQKVKQRLFEPVTEDEVERIPGLEPNRVQMLQEQGHAVGQQTLESVFGKQRGDMIREHIALGYPPEVVARAAAKTLTDWYSPAMLVASVPGRIAHGYAAGAEAAEKLGDVAKAAELAGKARLAGIIGTVSGIPFNAGQITSLVENWKDMSPAERGAAIAGVLGGTALTGVAVHEAVAPGTQNQKVAAGQQKETVQAQQNHQLSYQDIKAAAPPSSVKGSNYTQSDFTEAKPYLDAVHKTEPITSVKGLRDAAQTSIHKVENQVSQIIAAHPEIVNTNPTEFNPLETVREELAKSPRGEEFVNNGLKELESLKLDEPKTLEEWDGIRRQLNAESAGVMKKNSWDRYTAETSDPKVAAANVAADAIRDYIYDSLEDAGEPGARKLRQTEGSLMRIRNAADRQEYAGEKQVQGTGKGGALRKIATGTAGRIAAAGVGGAAGAALGGPFGGVAGATAGEEAARLLGQKLGTENLTRDQLIERAMNRPGLKAQPPGGPVTPGSPVNPNPTGPAGATVSVPAEQAPKTEAGPAQPAGKAGILERIKQALLQPPAWFREGQEAAERHREWINSPIGNEPDANRPPTHQPFPWESTEPEPKQMDTIRMPLQKPSQISALVLPEGYDTAAVHHHELAHAYVAAEEGLHPLDIISNTHPNIDSPLAAAATSFPKGDFDIRPEMTPEEINEHVDKVMATMFAGAAANELYDGIPHTDNAGLYGDFERAKRVLKEAGVPVKDYEQRIQEAVDRAKQHLTKPGVSDSIQRAAQTREGGLPDTHLYSGSRLQEIINDAREARDAIIRPAETGNTARGSAPAGRAAEATASGDEKENVPAAKITKAGLKESSTGDSEVDKTIKAAGGIPAGSMLDLALFHDPKTGSTLALNKSKITPEAVQQHLEESRAKFGVPVTEKQPEETELLAARRSEQQSPLKDKYGVEITDPDGKTHVEQMDAFSGRDAIKVAQKKFPDATEWSIKGTEKRAPSAEYSVPDKKLAIMKNANGRPAVNTIRHELGHAMVGMNDGFKADSMLTSSHPDMPSNARAAMRWDSADMIDPQTKRIYPAKMPAVLRMLMGGIAADEAFNDTPRDTNHNLNITARGSDGSRAFQLLTKDGVRPEDAMRLMDKAVSEAKEHLTKPEVSGIIKENENVREAGLSRQFHYSPERLQNMHEEAQRRIANGQSKGTTGPVSNNGSADGQTLGGRGQADSGGEGGSQGGTGEGFQTHEIADRVSTRVPTAVKSTEDAMGKEPLEIGTEAVNKAPGLAQKLSDLVRKYPGVKIPDTIKDPAKVLSRFQDHVVGNLKHLYNSVPEEQREQNRSWYPSANGIANEIADKHGLTERQGAGVIASLSPQKDWDMNVSLARRVSDIHHEQQDTQTSPEMIKKGEELSAPKTKANGTVVQTNDKIGKLLNNLKGKTYGQLTDPIEKAAWVRLYDEVNNPRDFHKIDPGTGKPIGLRTNANGAPSKVAWGSLNEIAKAISVMHDGSRENISDQLGAQHKVRNFYNNLVDPTNPRDVTIDTHAVAAALMRPLSGNDTEVTHNFSGPGSNLTGSSGTYPIYADAYRRAAKELGIMPRELQSVDWEKGRELFPDTFKTKANNAAISDIWKQYDAGKLTIDKARKAVVDYAEKTTGKGK